MPDDRAGIELLAGFDLASVTSGGESRNDEHQADKRGCCRADHEEIIAPPRKHATEDTQSRPSAHGPDQRRQAADHRSERDQHRGIKDKHETTPGKPILFPICSLCTIGNLLCVGEIPISFAVCHTSVRTRFPKARARRQGDPE